MATNGYPNYNIVNAENCSNIEVRNGNLVGDRLTHDYVTTNSSHCWGHGVMSTNNTMCNILNMEVSNMTGDAISTMTYSNGTISGTTNINDCNLHHCRRMGITIKESDIVNVKNTNIQYIGTTDNITGVDPMSGIDIEPHYDGTINYVLLDTVNIENIPDVPNTLNCGVVNGGPYYENVVKVDIINSKIERAHIKSSANIKNSKIIYPESQMKEINQCTMEDSYVYLSADTRLDMTDTIINNCVFEGDNISNGENDVSCMIRPTNVTVTNSTFKNIQGKGNYETDSQGEFGILLSANWGFTGESSNNVYDGCAIIYSNNMIDNNSEIKNSYVFKYLTNDITLNTFNLENCEIKVYGGQLGFNNSNIKECIFWSSAKPELYFNNSTMVCNSITTQDYFAIASTFNASTINVLGEVTKSAFSNVTFSNGSKIILDRYSRVNLDIPKSNLGTDYTIECNGTEVIE